MFNGRLGLLPAEYVVLEEMILKKSRISLITCLKIFLLESLSDYYAQFTLHKKITPNKLPHDLPDVVKFNTSVGYDRNDNQLQTQNVCK